MSKNALHIIILSLLGSPLFSQTGGDNVYEFLNLTNSGYVAALGGSNVSLPVNTPDIAVHNPALLGKGMDGALALDYTNYFAGINYGMALYAKTFKKAGNFAAGLTYLNYGTFTEADETGTITGNFHAAEYAFSLLWSREIDTLFSVGADLRPVLSYLEKYSSAGFAIDLGGSYHNESRLFSAGFVIRNIGCQLTSYAGERRKRLPLEIQAGMSQRLAYAPFRFSLTLRHLEVFDMTHDYAASDSRKDGFFENALRHVIAGAELIPHKNFYICGAYNFQRRKELGLDSKMSSAGLSWGFGINTSVIDLCFGRATYHLAGAATHVSLILKTDRIFKRGGI
jgi:hypothetical protein